MNLRNTSLQNERQWRSQVLEDLRSRLDLPSQGNESWAELLSILPSDEANQILSLEDPQEIEFAWWLWGRQNQQVPFEPFRFWLALAGRGWGKTRVGAETVREWARDPKERILLIAPTSADVRETMIEGPSGLLQCYPHGERPIYNPSRHVIFFPSGAIGITRSADEPERLRGPQFRKFWADEICAWRFLEEAWQQIMFGFRLPSPQLQGVITTTPKPLPVLKKLMLNPRTIVTRGSSHENKRNLSEQFFADVIAPYEGTRLGRQEIHAEVLEDIPGALWTRVIIEACRVHQHEVPADIVRCVVGVDPAVTAHETSDETGIVVAALASNGHVYVLSDLSMRGSPLEWARAVAIGYASHKCDRVVAEVNKGYDLVEGNVRNTLPNASYRSVRATRNKMIRAEPVAAMYEQGRVHHVGARFELLEDQMCSFVQGVTTDSPDRMDALVWAITDLVVQPEEMEYVVYQEPSRPISRY